MITKEFDDFFFFLTPNFRSQRPPFWKPQWRKKGDDRWTLIMNLHIGRVMMLTSLMVISLPFPIFSLRWMNPFQSQVCIKYECYIYQNSLHLFIGGILLQNLVNTLPSVIWFACVKTIFCTSHVLQIGLQKSDVFFLYIFFLLLPVYNSFFC